MSTEHKYDGPFHVPPSGMRAKLKAATQSLGLPWDEPRDESGKLVPLSDELLVDVFLVAASNEVRRLRQNVIDSAKAEQRASREANERVREAEAQLAAIRSGMEHRLAASIVKAVRQQIVDLLAELVRGRFDDLDEAVESCTENAERLAELIQEIEGQPADDDDGSGYRESPPRRGLLHRLRKRFWP